MTADGVRDVLSRMEDELTELRVTDQPESKKDEWKPPTVERIKERMGIKS